VDWRRQANGDRGGGPGPDGPLLPEVVLIVLIFALTLAGALLRLFG
jgi:hypothetical protein